jgi:hypothetical protein
MPGSKLWRCASPESRDRGDRYIGGVIVGTGASPGAAYTDWQKWERKFRA